MTLQFSSTLRNDRVGQIQTRVALAGGTFVLRILTGAEPANCAAAQTGTLLATINLPATFLTSSGGVTTIAGTWSVAASGTGTAGYWRIYDGAGTPVCHVQGDMTDLVLNNNSITATQTVTVTSFSVTDGNA